jgi:hypothetical protein
MNMTTTEHLNTDSQPTTTSWKHTPTRTIHAGGVTFAYRELGPRYGVPVVFLARS